MSKLRFSITMSVDGYVAGPNQSRDNPLGEGGMELHEWAFAARSWNEADGREGGEQGSIDDRYAEAWSTNTGAFIMGRNMFGPIRGSWGARSRGTAGGVTTRRTTPPSSCSRTTPGSRSRCRAGRPSTSSPAASSEALERARAAAGGRDVSIGGGASTIRQYLRAGLVDEMMLHVVPKLLGAGERLFENVGGGLAGFECVELVSSPAAAHFTYVRG